MLTVGIGEALLVTFLALALLGPDRLATAIRRWETNFAFRDRQVAQHTKSHTERTRHVPIASPATTKKRQQGGP